VQQAYSYRETLALSERIAWRIDDIIGTKRLDLTRPFLPDRIARSAALSFLSPNERLALNHIRGHGYLAMFGLVEEFILPFVLDHARGRLLSDDYQVRALLAFAGEEAKHIQLFRRFRAEFEEGFGSPCGVIGPAEEVTKAVMKHHPLAVALVTLHIEWMTQAHYVESVKDDQDLDPQFKSLLKHHWMEEAQHAKLDTLIVEALALGCDADELGRVFDDYLSIICFFDKGLERQVALDLESLARATGRQLDDKEAMVFRILQLRAQRWTFLGSGMTHPSFLATVARINAPARDRLARIGRAYC
jgi:hypothetical protein